MSARTDLAEDNYKAFLDFSIGLLLKSLIRIKGNEESVL